jgi:DNA-binding transcriptional ArsR family regulator
MKTKRERSSGPAPIADEHHVGPDQLRLVADPVREYLVNALVPQARTVAQLAAGLGCAPTRLYRHVQLLVDAGLLVVERERRVRGGVERHYRTVARLLKLDRARFAARSGPAGLQAILHYVFDQSRHDIEGAVASGRIDPAHVYPDPRSVVAWRTVARVTPAEFTRLQRKLRALYDEVERLGRRRAPRGEMISLALAAFPCDPVGQRARRAPRAETSR